MSSLLYGSDYLAHRTLDGLELTPNFVGTINAELKRLTGGLAPGIELPKIKL